MPGRIHRRSSNLRVLYLEIMVLLDLEIVIIRLTFSSEFRIKHEAANTLSPDKWRITILREM